MTGQLFVFNFLIYVFLCLQRTYAQESNLYVSNSIPQKRASLYKNLSKKIRKDLSYSLKLENEDSWLDAFASLQLLQEKDKFLDKRIENAFDSIILLSDQMRKSLIQVGYGLYPGMYKSQILNLLKETTDPEIFAFAAEYYLQGKNNTADLLQIRDLIQHKFADISKTNKILSCLELRIDNYFKDFSINKENLRSIFDKNFLPGEIVMISFQRKNRDFPGLVVIRNANGSFQKDSSHNFIHIPQLAKSINGMPYYLRYGNTPQGIYKMNGFGVSMSSFIGPTPNVQLQMPVEVSLQTFFKDSTIIDSVWNISYYQELLPLKLKNYLPLFESYYAGEAGRSEIIAHGTTINPDYYFGKPYFPHTPSEGCLTTSEIWNGKRIQSNQQALISGLLRAGGAHGYCMVIDLDNKQGPVQIEELMPFLKQAEKE